MCMTFLGGATTINNGMVENSFNGMALEKCTSNELVIDFFSRTGAGSQSFVSWGQPIDTCDSTNIFQTVSIKPGVCQLVSVWSSSATMYWRILDSSCDPPAPIYTLSLARAGAFGGGGSICTRIQSLPSCKYSPPHFIFANTFLTTSFLSLFFSKCSKQHFYDAG